MLLGADAMNKLSGAHVAVFGVGGVGGYTAEALVRSGIGRLTLVDNDTSPSGEKDFILFNPFKNYRNSAESSAPSIHVVTADIFR